MPATPSTAVPSHPKPPEPSLPRITRGRFSLSTTWINSAVVRITVTGEIDALNAQEFAGYVFRRAANSRRLILDMQGVTFLGTAGFSSLMDIHARCAHAAVNWMIVSSREVSRVLDICDPHATLPSTKS